MEEGDSRRGGSSEAAEEVVSTVGWLLNPSNPDGEFSSALKALRASYAPGEIRKNLLSQLERVFVDESIHESDRKLLLKKMDEMLAAARAQYDAERGVPKVATSSASAGASPDPARGRVPDRATPPAATPEEREAKFTKKLEVYLKELPERAMVAFSDGKTVEDITEKARKLLESKLDEFGILDDGRRLPVLEKMREIVAETFARFSKEKEEKEYEVFLKGLENTARDAMVRGENYMTVVRRTQAAYATGVTAFSSQRRLSDGAIEGEMEKIHKSAKKAREENKKGNLEKYNAWSEPWFTSLPQTYRAALDEGKNAEEVKREMIAVLEAQLGSVHDGNTQRFARRRFELIVDEAFMAWKRDGSLARVEDVRESPQEKLRDQEREAAREWLAAYKLRRRMQDLFEKGYNGDEVRDALRFLFIDTIKSLDISERRRWLGRLDQAIAREV